MLSLKIWPSILAIIIPIQNHNRNLFAVSFLHDPNIYENIGLLLSHNNKDIGCKFKKLCHEYEICHDDGLFGKCISRNSVPNSQLDISLKKINWLLRLKSFLHSSGVEWTNMYVQCILRYLLVDPGGINYNGNIFELCDGTTIDDNEVYKNIEFSNLMNLLFKNKYYKSTEFSDFDEIPITDFSHKNHFYNTERITDDALFKNVVKRALQRKVSKKLLGNGKFEKHVKISRNLIWLRLKKPIDYNEAARLLGNISSDLKIKPQIANFYLDKSGKILQFHIPLQSQIKVYKILNLLDSHPIWFNENSVFDIGIGIPPSTYAVEHNSNKHSFANKAGPTAFSSRPKINISRSAFITIVVISSLVLLIAFASFVYYLAQSNCFSSKQKSTTNSNWLNSPLLKHTGPLSIVESQQIDDEFLITKSQPAQPITEIFHEHFTNKGKGFANSFDSKNGIYSQKSAHLSSTSSWNEEPVQMLMDVNTGHLILAYMEEHLQNPDRLDADWEAIRSYESEEAIPSEVAIRQENVFRNRQNCPVPYEQTRVLLCDQKQSYINASFVYDTSPHTPVYIATQTPLPQTVVDFWQMVWEKFSVIIVCLEPEDKLVETNMSTNNGEEIEDNITQSKYWPHTGSAIFGQFEIRLVSEHKHCKDYVIRSFYLKESISGETRTITQFHFLLWSNDIPSTSINSMLEFRRKANRSFRTKKSPIIVHCVDGSGKTGTYLLLDLVLSRINKGVREIDVAATLEHLRDQRVGMVNSKAQFEYVLASIAEEVTLMLNTVSHK